MNASQGQTSIAAVSPFFEERLSRRHGVLTCGLTQVFTKHGWLAHRHIMTRPVPDGVFMYHVLLKAMSESSVEPIKASALMGSTELNNSASASAGQASGIMRKGYHFPGTHKAKKRNMGGFFSQ